MNWCHSIYLVFRSLIGIFNRNPSEVVNWTKRQVFCSFTQSIVLNLFTTLLFYIDYMMRLENEKRAPGNCQEMSWCSTAANCYGSDARGSYELTPGDCGPNTVCCTYFDFWRYEFNTKIMSFFGVESKRARVNIISHEMMWGAREVSVILTRARRLG